MTDQIQEQDVELDETDNEVVEEAHDPKNAEQQSVASVDKATGATKKAPARKGDKNAKDEPAPQGAGVKQPAQVESVHIDTDFSDDINALVESEATLSEEFKDKAAVIFEAAMKSKLAEEIDRLEQHYETELNEELERTRTDLVEKVDGYLNYVVETWMENNKLAIQNGLRSEIAEDFMDKLKDLFTESYIEVPEGKIDLVDDLAEQVEELEEKLNKSTEQSMLVIEELETMKRAAIVREAARDLAETQIEKLNSLAEGIEFIDQDDFASKVKTIKESYFAKKTSSVDDTVSEDIDETANPVEVSTIMEQYLAAIKKSSV